MDGQARSKVHWGLPAVHFPYSAPASPGMILPIPPAPPPSSAGRPVLHRIPGRGRPMPHTRIALILALLCSIPARAEPPAKVAPAKPLLESWQAAYYEGLKVGHLHTVARS